MEIENMEMLIKLLHEKKLVELKMELLSYNEADVANFIEILDPVDALAIFRILPKEEALETFSFFEPELQERFINILTDSEVVELVENLYIDDAVDMLEELPANVVKKVLNTVNPKRRDIINQYLNYPKDSAGSLMTAEYIGLRKGITVKQSITYIRSKGVDSENVYTCYIMSPTGKLKGYVTVRDLLTSEDDSLIDNLIYKDIISVTTTDDQEDVAKVFMKYNFVALPVVDHEDRLVGIITIDDVLDVIEEEATEDFEKMAAMAPSDKPYLKTSIFEMFKNRIGWLLILMISATLTASIINNYELLLSSITGLMAFVPMITDTGGNAGSQSSTMVIRGLALGDINTRDYLKVVFKETFVSLLTGFALAIVNFVRISITNPGQYMIAFTVSLTLIATVVMANVVGGLLPIIADKFKMDPAIMAAPLITTIVDALSLLVFFFFVSRILM